MKASTLEGKGTREADAAIREARAGRMSVPDMVKVVVAAQVYVPLAAEPVMEGNKITRWKPATITKQADGSKLLVAFTDQKLLTAFSRKAAEYPVAFLADVGWILGALPPAHGIGFNLDGENWFEWTAEAVAVHRSGAKPA